MNLTLPRPYPDELVYSVFARHFAHIQPTRLTSAYSSIDGSRWFSTRYVRGAAELAKRTSLTWGLSGIEIIERHTLLPFYGAFLQPDSHLECTAQFLADHPGSASTQMGLSNPSVAAPRFFRFCATCWDEDFRRLGETYWRRQHQLSGTTFCNQHNELLRNSTAPYSQRSLRTTLDATAHCTATAIPTVALTQNEKRMALQISGRAEVVLKGGLTPWITSNPALRYQNAAVELGYGSGAHKIEVGRFANDLVESFGVHLLEKLGCRVSSDSMTLRQIFRGSGTSHPLIHILVQLFLEKLLEASRSALKHHALDGTTRQEWKCPNAYANHDPTFRISSVELRRTKRRQVYFHAKCSCGLAFAFAESEKDDPNMPLVKKISGYGGAMEDEARRLYDRKRSVTYVASSLRVSHKAAGRLIARRKSRIEPDTGRILRLRQEWRTTRSRAAYQTLMRWDRHWVRSIAARTEVAGLKNGAPPSVRVRKSADRANG
ncbi:TnsD family Tn7-like transposition protein [Bradyrhizobium sp. Bra64]|uniref:TnsD family Tn7-like transposition protein n=1 Tax=Bradyrhizobium sp. Bra64 TaxID=2926009 RepID=UPI0021197611|nr:TnsD family Tn7-like transposition protein [Bradyrhizobium sp. Bra64]